MNSGHPKVAAYQFGEEAKQAGIDIMSKSMQPSQNNPLWNEDQYIIE
jgi:hypothetical protein